MEQKFKVIYTGQLQDSSDSAVVAERFAAKFKIPQEKALKIIKAGQEVVLQPGLEHVKAYKLKSALESLGMNMRLERVTISAQPAPKPAEQTTEPEPTTPAEAKPEASATTNNTSTVRPSGGLELEPMADPDSDPDSDDQEEAATTPSPESSESEKEKEKEPPRVASQVSTPAWELEPVTTDKEENDETEGEAVQAKVEKQEYVDLSKPAARIERKKAEEGADESQDAEAETHSEPKENPLFAFIKQFGGVVLAGLAGLFFLLKKFGLLKFLKVGGLMAAAAYAGYNPEEACMGNGLCEDAIDDQIDACWSYSELDQYDFDNMSDEQFTQLKPQIEEKFIGCFRYEDSGELVLENPIDLRFDLIDICENEPNMPSDCLALVEPQIKTCHARSEIGDYVKANKYDYFTTFITDMSVVRDFYACFEDHAGNMLFKDMVDQMNPDVMDAETQQALKELEQALRSADTQ